jgi:hypothetical protein
MITSLLFAAHIVFVAYIFTRKWQEDDLGTAFMNLALIVLLFSIGWAIAATALKPLMDPEGLGWFFTRDDASLLLTSLGEAFFYKIYYADEKTTADGTQT